MSGASFNTPGQPVSRKAAANIAPFRILKGNANDGEVLQSAAAGDKHLGVSGADGAAAGEPCDMFIDGVCRLEYGGNLSVGDPFTSDVDGKAILALPGQRHMGFAHENGDAGTIGSGQIAPGYVFGVAPGADGQVLTSTGTTWQSEVPPA